MSDSEFKGPKDFFIVFSSIICYILIGIAILLMILGLLGMIFGKGSQNLELSFGSDKELGLLAFCLGIFILLINLPYSLPLNKRRKRILLGINSLKNEISIFRFFYFVDLVFILLIIAMATVELSNEKFIKIGYLVTISFLLFLPVFHFTISILRFRKLQKKQNEQSKEGEILT